MALPLRKVAYGQGVYVYDTDGNQYIDGSAGPTLFCVGHGNPLPRLGIGRFVSCQSHSFV